MSDHTLHTRAHAPKVVGLDNLGGNALTAEFNVRTEAGGVLAFAARRLGDSAPAQDAEDAFLKETIQNQSLAAVSGIGPADEGGYRLNGAAVQAKTAIKAEKKREKEREHVTFMSRLQAQLKAIKERIEGLERDIEKWRAENEQYDADIEKRDALSSEIKQIRAKLEGGQDVDWNEFSLLYQSSTGNTLSEHQKSILSDGSAENKDAILSEIERDSEKNNAQSKNSKAENDAKIKEALDEIEKEQIKALKCNELIAKKTQEHSLISLSLPSPISENTDRSSSRDTKFLENIKVSPQENALAMFQNNALAITEQTQKNDVLNVDNDLQINLRKTL